MSCFLTREVAVVIKKAPAMTTQHVEKLDFQEYKRKFDSQRNLISDPLVSWFDL